MFIILISFKKPLEQYLTAHRNFLDECYAKNYFMASGQNKQHTGGAIISQLNDQAQLEEILKQDPLYIHEITDYEIVEFTPTKYHSALSVFINNNGEQHATQK